jgi:hypothetical protein
VILQSHAITWSISDKEDAIVTCICRLWSILSVAKERILTAEVVATFPQIDELFRRFSSNPVFVIIDVRPNVEGIPVTAYRSKEEVEGVRR